MTTATWYLWEDDGRVLINMDEGRVRLKHLRRDPRVSLTVLDKDDWYTLVTLIGRVAEIGEDEGLSGIDRLSQRYLRHRSTAMRDRRRVQRVDPGAEMVWVGAAQEG